MINQINQKQSTLIDAYICARCNDVHYTHSPEYRSHFGYRYIHGVGKIARAKLHTGQPIIPPKTVPKKKKTTARKVLTKKD